IEHSQPRLHAVERDGEGPFDKERLKRLLITPSRTRRRGKARALHRRVGEVDGACKTVDLRYRRYVKNAEYRVLAPWRQDGNGRVGRQIVAIPAIELRLENRIRRAVELRRLRPLVTNRGRSLTGRGSGRSLAKSVADELERQHANHCDQSVHELSSWVSAENSSLRFPQATRPRIRFPSGQRRR